MTLFRDVVVPVVVSGLNPCQAMPLQMPADLAADALPGQSGLYA